MNKPELSLRRSTVWASLLLLVAAIFYCHRFYGASFFLDGDGLINTYFRLHGDLVAADHNPHQLHYMSQWVPHTGRWNVLLRTVDAVVRGLFPRLEPVTAALVVNGVTSCLALWLFALSLALWIRWAGLSWLAAITGAVAGAFTGFVLVGVREFDVFYLLSAAAIAPTWIAHAGIASGKNRLRYAAWGALPVGLTLLCGSNTPLFYVVPLLFLLPLLDQPASHEPRRLLKSWGAQCLSIALGVAIAAPIWWPALAALAEWNRSGLRFQGGLVPLDLPSLARSLFLRDWWITNGSHYHERDAFLGLPVLALALLGVLDARSANPRERRWLVWAIACLVWGLLISLFKHWPTALQVPVASFFEQQSIRYPNRFFFCVSLAAACLAARGVERIADKRLPAIIVLLAVAQAALISRALSPVWQALLPDTQRAAELSLSAAGLAAVALLIAGALTRHEKTKRIGAAVSLVAVFGIFAMHLFGPQQLTLYPSRFLARPHVMERLPSNRLEWPRVLGLRSDYAHGIAHARAMMLEAPAGMEDPMTRKGRGIDVGDGGGGALTLHAAATGHEYAFSYAHDPAAPWRLKALLGLGNPALIDLGGACWAVSSKWEDLFLRGSGAKPAALAERPSCFEQAFIASGFRRLPDANSLLTWLSRADHRMLARDIAVDCRESDCALLPESAGDKVARQLSVVEKKPGRLIYDVGAGQGAVLFLSVPFHPGWSAKVGPFSAPVIRADLAYMAVRLPPDATRVELTFTPPSVERAVWVAALALLLIGVLLTPGLKLRLPVRDVAHAS